MKLGSPTAGKRRWAIFIILPVAAAFVAVVVLIASSNRLGAGAPGINPPSPTAGSSISLADWDVTSDGDFEERTIDTAGRRLRMRVATRATRPDTVKFLGLRRREEIRLTEGTRLSVDLDWNNPDNGTGLTAGIVLSPESTTGNPFQRATCLSLEYIGVPPGRNARLVIGARDGGNHRHLVTEGWPDNKVGRRIGLQKLQLEIGKGRTFRILENGKEVYSSGSHPLPFDRAYLYLQVSSRPNYAPRDIYFDNVVVDGGK